MMPVVCRWAAVLLSVLLLAACGMAARPRPEFEPAFREYAQRLRWRDYQTVAGYLAEPHREDFRERFSSADDLNIVDVRMEAVDFGEADRKASTTIAIEYFMLPSLTVKKVRLHQNWIYEGEDRYHSGAWRLADPFPPFP